MVECKFMEPIYIKREFMDPIYIKRKTGEYVRLMSLPDLSGGDKKKYEALKKRLQYSRDRGDQHEVYTIGKANLYPLDNLPIRWYTNPEPHMRD